MGAGGPAIGAAASRPAAFLVDVVIAFPPQLGAVAARPEGPEPGDVSLIRFQGVFSAPHGTTPPGHP
jgi:hypothetical protein